MNRSLYIKLPPELGHHLKGLINIKNEDNEWFRWCHVRLLNPDANKDRNRITKQDKIIAEQLNYDGIEFPVTVKQYNKIEKQNNININVFGYQNKQQYPIYISKEQYNKTWNLLLITEGDNKYYVLMKDFNKFMFTQTVIKFRLQY